MRLVAPQQAGDPGARERFAAGARGPSGAHMRGNALALGADLIGCRHRQITTTEHDIAARTNLLSSAALPADAQPKERTR
jgi:hypothetical protein